LFCDAVTGCDRFKNEKSVGHKVVSILKRENFMTKYFYNCQRSKSFGYRTSIKDSITHYQTFVFKTCNAWHIFKQNPSILHKQVLQTDVLVGVTKLFNKVAGLFFILSYFC